MTNTTASENTLLEKIALLLRKAENTDNAAEADAFMAKAQQLVTLHQIDIEKARSWVPVKERRETPVQEYIRIGEARTWGLPQYCDLFMAIGQANDLRFRIFTDYTAVKAIGFPSDIDTVKVLYASVLTQMVEASNRYIKAGEWRSETVYREGTCTNSWGEKYKDWGYFPVTARQARASFMDAYARRIGQRLSAAREEAIKKAQATEVAERRAQAVQSLAAAPTTAPWEEDLYMDLDDVHQVEVEQPSSTALVLAAKTDEITKYYDEQYGARDRRSRRSRGSWQSKANTSVRGARQAGVSAANSARITQAKGVGGSAGALGA